MTKTLVILESPNKCGKFREILGKDYIISASCGHIRNLDPKSLGIDMIKGVKPKDLKADNKAGRDFILDHTEEFLNFAVDYSLNDKMSEFLYEKNSE